MPDLPFADFGLKWFTDIVDQVAEWFRAQLTDGFDSLTDSFFGSPLPSGSGTDLIFQPPAPANQPWRNIYEATVGGEVMLLGLLVLFLSVQGHHFVRIFNPGSAYASRRVSRSAWLGAILIVAWYWVGVLTLYLVEGLTIGLLPDITVVAQALLDILPVSLTNPMLTLLMASVGGLSMVALKALYFIRRILLFVYLYGMPIGIGLAFGGIPIVSRIAARLCKQFLPLAILPIPAAVLFRGYELLFAGDGLTLSPTTTFFQYLVVISLPVLALLVTWKTFRYASPLAARMLGRTTTAAVTIGTVVGAATLSGPAVASTAARSGPKAAAMTAAG